MTPKTIWIGWPNRLGIDAALIAVAWLGALAKAYKLQLGVEPYLVLALSVWLTYAADRLYDVRNRSMESLHSLRHQFAKRHRKQLWKYWSILLAINLCLATQLSAEQLTRGGFVLATCLSYTLLNQKLSKRYFPKEICVAFIFAAGVVIFLPIQLPVGFIFSFGCLCWLNCLIISSREIEIDQHMGLRSMTRYIGPKCIRGISIFTCLLSLGFAERFGPILSSTALCLLITYELRSKIHLEDFRVLADGILFIAALLALF